jgi:hypothetical protein
MRRFPLILIPLTATLAAMIYCGFAVNLFAAFLAGYAGFVVMFVGGTLIVNGFRHWLINRHWIGKLSYDEFKALCQANADARVAFQDSVRSGNCYPGTRDFVKRTFRGRKSITLGELLPYCRTGYRVKNVALYVLIQLSKRSALRAVTKEVAT